MKTPREIPQGWTRELDGSYSPPKTAKQINAPLVGAVDLDAGSKVSKSPLKTGVRENEAARVGFQVRKMTDEEKLNKTEKAYLAHLRGRVLAWVGIQNITLKLADDTRLTPDFSYINAMGAFTFVDVKGFQREDALIKMKVAARQFSWARFIIVSREGGGWSTREVNP